MKNRVILPRMISVFSVFGFILAAFLPSCGGGGGGGGGSGPKIEPAIPYAGVTDPAQITADHALDLVSGAAMGMQYADAPNDSLTKLNRSRDLGGTSVLQVLEGVVSATLEQSRAARSALGRQVDEPIPGDCTGYADVTGSVNDETGAFDLNISFHNYSDDCVLTMSGRTNQTGAVTQDLQITHLTVTSEALEVSEGDVRVSLSGVYGIDYRQVPVRLDMDVVLRDESTGKTYWLNDYVMLLSDVIGVPSQQMTIESGRYYDPDLGYVEITTQQPLLVAYGEEFPYEGVLIFTGALNGALRVTALTPVLFQVEGDLDGDGAYDDYASGTQHWPGQNNLPVADAGSDVQLVARCLTSLSGVASSDFDEDPLQFAWSIVHAPENSVAQLVTPNSVTTTFTPDLPGTYIVSLIVDDGYDQSVEDTVTVTATDGFFCSWELEGEYLNAGGGEIALGDFNFDGRSDAVVTTGSGIEVFLQEPQGGLGPAQTYAGGNGTSLDVGDVNGDGRDDVVVTLHDGFGVFYQNLSGTLEPMLTYTSSNSYFSQVRLGDLNHDGRVDVALVQNVTDAVDVFYQNAGGSFDPATTYSLGTFNVNGLQLADVTGDGWVDGVLFNMALLLEAPEALAVLSQTSSGGLGAPQLYVLSHGGTNWGVNEMTVGDLDGDGRQDLLVTFGGNTPNAFLGVFPQLPGGGFGSPVVYDAYDAPTPVAMFDFDGDGAEEVVVGNPGWNSLTLYRRNAGGGLLPFVRYELTQLLPYVQAYSMAIGDVDADGMAEILISDHDRLVIFDPSLD